GIAKLLDPEDSTGTIPTESLLLLTPEHAAPEQFLGGPITTATDVYQLGVLLYQLLTGARPFQATTAVELSREICELEPTRPSASTADSLRKQVRGDLDRIVLMALRKEPARRYGSAA